MVGAFLLSLLGRGARISLLARGLGGSLPLPQAIGVQLTGEAAAAVTPSRSGSDPARLLVMRRWGVDLPTGLAVLVGEMMAEGLLLLAVVGVFFVLLPDSKVATLAALPYGIVALALPFLTVVLARIPADRGPPRLWGTVGLRARQWQRLRDAAKRFRGKARALMDLEGKTVFLVLLVSLAHMLARLAILPLLTLSSAPSAPLGPLLAWPLVFLYAGSLLPPPGGGGAIELGFVAAPEPIFGGATLTSLLFWWRWYTFYLGGLLGGLFLCFSLGKTKGPGKNGQV